MGSEASYTKLLHKPGGTFLLRENEKGELRFSVRSNVMDVRSNTPKVGHIRVEKTEDGNGWIIGGCYYESISEMIKSPKQIDSSFLLKNEYIPSIEQD